MNATNDTPTDEPLKTAETPSEVYDLITDLERGDKVLWGDRSIPATVVRVVYPDDPEGQALTASVLKHNPENSTLGPGDVFASPGGRGLTGKTFALIAGPRGGFYALARCKSRGRTRPALFRAVRSYHKTRLGRPGEGAFGFDSWFDEDVRVVDNDPEDAPDLDEVAEDLPTLPELEGHPVVAYDPEDEEHYEVGEATEVLSDLHGAHEDAREAREQAKAAEVVESVEDGEFERDVEGAVGTARVVETFSHEEYGLKAVVETPAPWDVPDDVTPANDAVKSTSWNDTHYAFDGDREAWTCDLDGLDDVADALADAGYEVVDARDEETETADGDEQDDDPDPEPEETFEEYLTRFLSKVCEGDVVEVRYEQKNGAGMNDKRGEVVRRAFPKAGRDVPSLLFERGDGQRMRVKPEDDGVEGALETCGAMYPYVGRVAALTVLDEAT